MLKYTISNMFMCNFNIVCPSVSWNNTTYMISYHMILHMMIVLVLVPILRTFTISIREKVQFTTTTFTYFLSPSEVNRYISSIMRHTHSWQSVFQMRPLWSTYYFYCSLAVCLTCWQIYLQLASGSRCLH